MPDSFSFLAKNLFLRLTKMVSSQRYLAYEALNHPWITRNNETDIPMSIVDKLNHFDASDILREKVLMMFFISLVKGQPKPK